MDFLKSAVRILRRADEMLERIERQHIAKGGEQELERIFPLPPAPNMPPRSVMPRPQTDKNPKTFH
ncbi:MAG TPA: hypothetical protein VFR09_02500 [Alphaproteobacteria bacterium]|nr:hypothetical protein [Alphaproteobacteria bacterium]